MTRNWNSPTSTWVELLFGLIQGLDAEGADSLLLDANTLLLTFTQNAKAIISHTNSCVWFG